MTGYPGMRPYSIHLVIAWLACVLPAGCDCQGAENALDADHTGDGGGDAKTPVSCSGVPAESFDPLAGYAPPALVPSLVVSTVADDGPGSLRAALRDAPADAVIGFSPDLAGQTIVLASTLELDRSVTIDGSAAPGITLDGNDQVRILRGYHEAPRTYRLFALRFVRGRTTGPGGAMAFNGADLHVEVGGCHFEGNTGTEGGAIRVGYRLVSTTHIHDSTFVGNFGEVGSTGFSGGAISATATNLTVERCRFERNVGVPAGAVYTIHAQPLVTDSVFVDNSSSDGAGGFFADGGGPGDSNNPTDVDGRIELRRNRFARNVGHSANGGAALLWGYPMDDITVEDSLFIDNHVMRGTHGAQGGALKVHIESAAGEDKRFRAARVSFIDNISENQGGALWLDGNGRIEIENAVFSGNTAEGDRGGGITFNQPASTRVTVDHATFVDNAGGNGCGAFWLNSATANVTMRNSIIAHNRGANAWEVQFGYPPIDGGGNVMWPAPTGGSQPLGAALVVDPGLEPLAEIDGMLVRPAGMQSPIRDSAIAPAPPLDVRGALRDAMPDIGAFEIGAGCGE
ncbi:MAG: right-handed parallel beta-helix repeat-containing protein [Kofleriaceae bacterium]|nr:right-handed parallel beta-helix repeat-containing protein [Kofleriaceae bacterium]